jgi:hypothetical protein
LWTLVMILALAACTTGEKVRMNLEEGMTKDQVITTLGRPDGAHRVRVQVSEVWALPGLSHRTCKRSLKDLSGDEPL